MALVWLVNEQGEASLVLRAQVAAEVKGSGWRGRLRRVLFVDRRDYARIQCLKGAELRAGSWGCHTLCSRRARRRTRAFALRIEQKAEDGAEKQRERRVPA